MTATPFLQKAGTNGFIATPFDLQSTELNSLADTNTAIISVGGTSGVFSQPNWGNSMFGRIWFKAGGAFTPASGGILCGWFLRSPDGGSAFERYVADAVQARGPDFVIPLFNSAYAANELGWVNGIVMLPFESCKVLIRNQTGVALPSSGNHITLGPVAVEH